MEKYDVEILNSVYNKLKKCYENYYTNDFLDMHIVMQTYKYFKFERSIDGYKLFLYNDNYKYVIDFKKIKRNVALKKILHERNIKTEVL